jgi:hypothetical protein
MEEKEFYSNQSLSHIADFVDKKAAEQKKEIHGQEAFIEAKKNLKKYSNSRAQEFTFTIGEINAYMG